MNTKTTPTLLGGAAALLALCLSLLLTAGCSGERETAPAALRGTVRIKGSNTFGEELAPKLIAEYRKSRPDVTIEWESKGSGSGFAALLAGECDLAASSRGATPEEISRAKAKGIEFKEYAIGHYGVAVIVHQSNPLTALSEAQVKDIFTGAVGNWKAVGGADTPIRIFIRDAVAGTNLGFRELAMENQPYTQDARTFASYAELAEAVAQDPGAIGYSSMHLAQSRGIKAVKIGKTEPTYLSVNEGWYPYARMLRLYSNGAVETPAAHDFARFVQRAPGQKILEDLGFVRRFEAKLKSLTPD